MSPFEKLQLTAVLLATASLIALPGLAGRARQLLRNLLKRRRTRRLRRRFATVYARMGVRVSP